MATLCILILLLIAALLFIAKRRRSGLTVLLFTILCFIGIGNGFVPALLLKQLQAPFLELSLPQWKSKNAIVLLGAGVVKLPGTKIIHPTIMAYSRINTAAFLYFNCISSHKKCEIIISGGDALKVGESEATVYQNALTDLGVNHSDILLESNSMNTYKNAEFTSAILNKNEFDQVILVTSGIHLRRALLYFSHFGVYPKPACADYLVSRIGFLTLGYNFAMTDFAIHEYLGIARFHIYNFLGWNKEVSCAGAP